MRQTLEGFGRLLKTLDWRRDPTPTLEERVQAVEYRVDSLAVRVEELAEQQNDEPGK